MIETRYALRQSYPATFVAGVARTLQIGPSAAYTRWVLSRYTIITSSQLTVYPSGNFVLYRGDPALGFQLDFTQRFMGDTSSANDVELSVGDYVVGVWTGPATFTGTATLTIDGSIFVKGRRSY